MWQFDRQLTISIGTSRKAKLWTEQTLYWSELVERLKTPVRSAETLAEYLRLPRSRQDDLKDVGGFVGGRLVGNRRKAGSVAGRDVITLDFDNIPMGQTEDILRRAGALGCAYALYSTRKHEPVKPRLRLVVPMDRTCSADEYQPVSRKLAERLGIEFCDPSTFEASRLMYWASCCSDSQYVFNCADMPFLCVDAMLGMYKNWRDCDEWAEVPGARQAREKLAQKQGDPTQKQGVVGAFCRVYDIHSAINAYLPDVYTPCMDATGDIDARAGRYTYSAGSTTGGGAVYEGGNFLYSHHATDPAGGRLCNAFDLVRLHLYSGLDDDAKPDTPTNKLPSYCAMRELAVADSEVSALLGAERYASATQSFKHLFKSQDANGDPPDNGNWLQLLQLNSDTGAPVKTTDNVIKILENDPLLKGKLAFDEFANRGLVMGSLPWNQSESRRDWADLDDAGLRHYFEHVYGITGQNKLIDGAALVAYKNRFNDVVSFLTSLAWDGVPRLDRVYTDYLGADDNIYTRTIARKSLTAAVARAMNPGCKYDTMTVLVGPQGMGKSTFLKILGGKWFSDSLMTFEGKEACELIQGVWINEIGELAGYSRSEKNAVKLFLSRTDDIFREPYGRRTARYPRRCVFFGTTNDHEFLRDNTGERRFWPVDVGVNPAPKSVFAQLEEEAPQIWAEAYTRWQNGESLYLPKELEALAKRAQECHKESSAKDGIIRDFVSKPVPAGWERRDAQSRRMYWSCELQEQQNAVQSTGRDRICAVEVWCECLGGEVKTMRRSDAAEINAVLASIDDFRRAPSPVRCGPYGHQRAFIRSNLL